MRAILLSLAFTLLLAGCLVGETLPSVDYAFCADTVFPTSVCEPYYVWIPWGGHGHYVLRPGWRGRWHHGIYHIEHYPRHR